MTRHGSTALGSAGLLLLLQGLVGCGNGDASPSDPTTRGNDVDPAAVEHPNDAAVYKGKLIFEEVSCDKCHSLDGEERSAETLLGMYGTEIELVDGTMALRDDAYMRDSLLEPLKHIPKAYADQEDEMPTYDTMLVDREIDALVALIKSLAKDD